MQAHRWDQIEALFSQSLTLPAAQRQSFIDDLCKNDPVLRDELASLLLAHDQDSGPLDFAPEFAPESVDAAYPPELAGTQVGPYRLLRQIGEGGMGSVWLAERADGALKRNVALKRPHVSWMGPLGDSIFQERDILASLEHPNIARLYDAGVSGAGQPYLALEYVEGVPITEFCSAHDLGMRERLELFLQVLDAVQYAHAHLIIHRDIKPSNILVSTAGRVHLLDFGIAQLLKRDFSEDRPTEGVGALTPDYASPEQFRGEAVSTASDVYSLGVVLYEILAGSRPYRLKDRGAAARAQALTQIEVPALSEAAVNPSIKRHAHGDIEAIIGKAMRQQPAERYASADALARDIERSLRNEPVEARPYSRRYFFKKFYLRNKLAFGASALVFLSLVAGIGAASWQAERARANESRAIAAANTSETIKKFLINLFKVNTLRQEDPAKARTMNALDLLEAGADRVAVDFKDNTPLHRELLSIIINLLAESRSGAFKQHALEYIKLLSEVPDSGLEQARIYLELSIGQEASSEAESAGYADEGLKVIGESTDAAHRNIRAQLMLQHARTVDEDLTSDELSGIYLAAKQMLEPEFRNTAEYGRLLEDMGILEIRRNHVDLAVDYLERALRATQSDPTAYERSVARIHSSLGWGYRLRKQYRAAENEERIAESTFEKGYGKQDVETAFSEVRLGAFISLQNRFDEAISLLQPAVVILERPSPHFNVGYLINAVYELANTLVQAGRLAEADQVVQRMLAIGEKDPPRYQAAYFRVKSDYDFLRGRLVAAEQDARRELDFALQAFGSADSRIPVYKNRLGTRLFEIGKLDEAEVLATANLAGAAMDAEPFDSAVTSAGILKAKIFSARGNGRVAAGVLRTALARFRAQPADRQDPNDEVDIRLALGRAYLADNQASMAQPELERALVLRETQFIGSPRLAEAQMILAECKDRLGDRDAARSLLVKARATLANGSGAGRQYREMLGRLMRGVH